MIASTLKKGSKGSEVTVWQRFLNEHQPPSPALVEDGDFGPKTDAATKAWQRANGLMADGIVGPLTRAKAFGQPATTPSPSEPYDAAGGVDERSARNIATLNQKVRPYFERIAIEGTRIAKEMGADGYIMISGNRSYAEQNALYAKGRTAPGPKVTNAKGGYSNHNFAVAGDFGVFKGGVYLDSSNPSLASKIHKAVAAWVKKNLPEIAWGGDWTSFRDEPHYEFKTGLTLAQMRERVAAGKSVV